MAEGQRINLLYLSPYKVGGWATYTRHLTYGLRQLGWDPRLVRITKRSYEKPRDFGFGLEYWNHSFGDVQRMAREEPTLLVVLGKQFFEEGYALLAEGVPIVIHDAVELTKGDVREHLTPDRTFVIRPNLAVELPGSRYLPHPYWRAYTDEPSSREINAVALSRIDFDKYTHVILEANKMLAAVGEPDLACKIYGTHNRLYAHHKLAEEHPDWQDHVGEYPSEAGWAEKTLHRARYMVDLTYINGDGAGTQYTFLEAWDAGAVPVLNARWTAATAYFGRAEGLMRPGKNCLSVEDARELAGLLRGQRDEKVDLDYLVAQGRKQLDNVHDAATVARQYLEAIGELAAAGA